MIPSKWVRWQCVDWGWNYKKGDPTAWHRWNPHFPTFTGCGRDPGPRAEQSDDDVPPGRICKVCASLVEYRHGPPAK